MKSFYKLTSRGFSLMANLDQALDNLAELEIFSEDVTRTMPEHYQHLYQLFGEYNDMEFCDVDIIRQFPEIRLGVLESNGLIEETYTDND